MMKKFKTRYAIDSELITLLKQYEKITVYKEIYDDIKSLLGKLENGVLIIDNKNGCNQGLLRLNYLYYFKGHMPWINAVRIEDDNKEVNFSLLDLQLHYSEEDKNALQDILSCVTVKDKRKAISL